MLVNTSAVQALGWSSILGRCHLEESYLSILAISISLSNPNKDLSDAAKAGDMDLVLYFVSQGANYWNGAMRGAAEGGHMDLVLYFVSRGANDWNDGMCVAAEGGHMDLVLYFVSQGANWTWGLSGARAGGHEKLVEFFKSKMN